MDNFFDCFNVSSFNQGRFKRKPFQQPYRNPTDFRLKFLKDITQYLDGWKSSVKKRQGFSDKEKKSMTLSTESEQGIRINVSSFLELLPNLLTCFLSEKLTQDPLEKFFGCQRQKGKSNENPTVLVVG